MNVRPGAVRAQDERLEVRFGVADLHWPEACPFDGGVHLRAIEHPSDNRAAPVAQQEDAVRVSDCRIFSIRSSRARGLRK